MPYMKDGHRDYRREYDLYHSTAKQRHNRSLRTTLRRQAEQAGIVHKGDSKDLDHIQPLSHGGSNSMANARVVSAGRNRSFSRNADGSLKNQTSKREQ